MRESGTGRADATVDVVVVVIFAVAVDAVDVMLAAAAAVTAIGASDNACDDRGGDVSGDDGVSPPSSRFNVLGK